MATYAFIRSSVAIDDNPSTVAFAPMLDCFDIALQMDT
jgi:hypothetical protein